MLTGPTKNSREFAADLVNAVKTNTNGLAEEPTGHQRDLTFDQAAAVSQVMALNAIAAGLLAVADAITSRK